MRAWWARRKTLKVLSTAPKNARDYKARLALEIDMALNKVRSAIDKGQFETQYTAPEAVSLDVICYFDNKGYRTAWVHCTREYSTMSINWQK